MAATSGSAFTLFVETGLHAGTVQRLLPGMHTLGSELDADIVLSDLDVKAIHLIIELDHRGLRLEPLQGAIAIDGEGEVLEPGGERHLPFPASFSLGNVTIMVTAPTDRVQTKRRVRAAAFLTGTALLALVGFQVIDPVGRAASDEPVSPLAATKLAGEPEIDDGLATPGITAKKASDTEPPESDQLVKTVPEVTLDDAAAALRARLEADGLRHIEVKTAVDRLLVRGEAEPERMADWRTIRVWFDGTFGQDVLLVAAVDPVENREPPALAIEAVWSGDDPYLIAGGKRFFLGAAIGDGWTIERIDAVEITFRRGNRTFSLTL